VHGCLGLKTAPGCPLERGSAFGSGLGLILRFLVVGKERRLLAQAAAQEGSA